MRKSAKICLGMKHNITYVGRLEANYKRVKEAGDLRIYCRNIRDLE
ncbi:hypothetical protein M8C21_005073, partial [Ambrosia artemisiifolia]